MPLTVAISTLIVQPQRSGSNESYLVNLVRALAARRDDVEYILFVSDANRALFEGLDARVRFVTVPGAGASRAARIATDQLAIGPWARRLGAGVVHFPGTVGSAREAGPPQVVTIHYDLDPLHLPSIGGVKRKYFTHLMRRTCRIARVLVVPSATFRESFVQRWSVPEDRVRVVYHGVAAEATPAACEDSSRLLERLSLQPGFILSVTNDLPHKNLPVLLEAYGLLRARGVMAPLVLAGNIAADRVGAWLASPEGAALRVPPASVVLTGYLPHHDVLALYRAALVMATPTLTESSSMPVLEAMASGCPVVASDLPVHREIAGDAACLVDARSAEGFARAIGAVVDDGGRRQTLIASGRRVAARFNWDRTAGDMVSAYMQAATPA